MNSKAKFQLRICAGAWAAAVVGGAFCALSIILYFRNQGTPELQSRPEPVIVFWIILATALAAGISGYWIGWHLLEPDEYHEAETAIALGIATAALAYPLLFVILAIGFATADLIERFRGDPRWQAIPIDGYVLWLILGPLFGIIYTGWITLPIGGIAGYFFSRRFRKRYPSYKRSQTRLPGPDSGQRNRKESQ